MGGAVVIGVDFSPVLLRAVPWVRAAAESSMLVVRGPMAGAPRRILVAVDDVEISPRRHCAGSVNSGTTRSGTASWRSTCRTACLATRACGSRASTAPT